MNKLALAKHLLKTTALALRIKAKLDGPARTRRVCESIHLKQYNEVEKSLTSVLQSFFERQAKLVADKLDRLATPENEKNCGTGAGGFKPGNTCARGGGAVLSFGGNEVKREDDVDAACQRIFGRTLTDDEISGLGGAPSGSKVRARVNSSGMLPQLVVKWTNEDIKGDGLRYILKGISGTIISNQGITIRDGGAGYGTQILKHQVDTGVKIGADIIVTIAEASDASAGTVKNGYYTWPRLGYDAPLPYSIKEKIPEQFKSAKRISDLMKTPEGRSWWKANGTDVEVTFDLKEGSLSRSILDEYTKAKAGISGGKSTGIDDGRRRDARRDLGQSDKNCGTGAGGFKPGNTCARVATRAADRQSWFHSLPEKERAAVYAWAVNGHREIRKYEGHGVDGAWDSPYADKGAQWSDASRLLNKALASAPIHKGPIYRGLKELTGDTVDRLTAVGSVLQINATSSYSESRKVAESFAHSSSSRYFAVLKVAKPKTAVQMVSYTRTGEAEVVGLKGTQYKIVSSKPFERNGSKGFEIELEEI